MSSSWDTLFTNLWVVHHEIIYLILHSWRVTVQQLSAQAVNVYWIYSHSSPPRFTYLYVLVHGFCSIQAWISVLSELFHFLPGGSMLNGRLRGLVEFVLSSVSYYQILTLWNLVRAMYEISFWAVAFEPKTGWIIAGAAPPLSSSLSHFTINFIHSHTGLYGIGLVKGRRWQGVSPKYVSWQVEVCRRCRFTWTMRFEVD